jgi:hypothetical protein
MEERTKKARDKRIQFASVPVKGRDFLSKREARINDPRRNGSHNHKLVALPKSHSVLIRFFLVRCDYNKFEIIYTFAIGVSFFAIGVSIGVCIMVESNKPDRINVGMASFNARAFFEAVPASRELAIGMLRSQVPATGQPTPRAQEYIDNGEWDSNVLLVLSFVPLESCTGRVGTVTEGDTARFCGLRPGSCSSRAHMASVWSLFRLGWFIPGGTHKGAGVFRAPSLPRAEQGGPITSTIAKSLRDPTDPFSLSVGQWKFVISE